MVSGDVGAAGVLPVFCRDMRPPRRGLASMLALNVAVERVNLGPWAFRVIAVRSEAWHALRYSSSSTVAGEGGAGASSVLHSHRKDSTIREYVLPETQLNITLGSASSGQARGGAGGGY